MAKPKRLLNGEKKLAKIEEAMLKISDKLSLPIEAVTQTFAILAKRGAGKTYTACVMVEEMLRVGQQVVVADPIGVWWGLRSPSDGKATGFPIVIFGGEHADVLLEEHAGEIIAGAIVENGFSAILDLSLLRKAAQVRFMTAFAEALYRLNRKPLHFAVDEADSFAPQRPLPGEQRLLGAFEDIVRRGRARGLGVTLITQRAAVLNKNVLTQIEVLVCLRTISPQDREAIEAWIEVHGTEKQRATMLAELPSLEIGTAFFWSPGWLDLFKKVQVRTRTTFDSSSTPKVGEKVVRPKEMAPVDLEQLGAQIKSTVEKQKENDPTILKHTITELKKQISVTQKVAPPEIKEMRVFTVDDRKLLETVENKLAQCEKLIEDIKRMHAKSLPPPPPPKTFNGIFTEARKSPAYKAEGREPNGEIAIGKCERAILTALAQYPQGRTAVQVALLSKYSVSSGGFNNSLGKLRSAGFITRSNPMQITPEGLAELGEFNPLPMGEELVRHWMNSLPKCERAILSALADCYPNYLNADELAEKTGYSRASGGFNNALGKLRTLELINRGQPIRVSENLFP